jgi:hypothetical protein
MNKFLHYEVFVMFVSCVMTLVQDRLWACVYL